MPEPRFHRLDAVADFLSGGTPHKSTSRFWDGHIPWLTPKDMNGFDGTTTDYVTSDALGNGTRLAPENSLFIAVRGMSLHNEIRILQSRRSLAFNQDIKAIVPHSIDSQFLYYALSAQRPYLLRSVESAGHGTGRLPTDKLASLAIPDLPFVEQQAIASILGSLDDKIDLNRRMNEILEAIGRALFKEWFVDFGPVRAKMEERDREELATEIAALFPDSLDSEGRPQGWRAGTLSEIAQSWKRGINPTEVSVDMPYIGLEHMPRRSVALTEWEYAEKVTSNKLRFHQGEILFGKLRPYFHKVGIAPIDGLCSTDIIVASANEAAWDGYVLMCMSSDEFVAYANRTADGTKMPRTKWDVLKKYSLSLPPASIAMKFNDSLRPLMDRIIANIHESRTLTQLRDLLLPKLMSGEIRVAEAEQLVGDAV